MKLCPFDMMICADPVCRHEGCQKTGERVFDLCDWCGDPFTGTNCVAVCLICLNRED